MKRERRGERERGRRKRGRRSPRFLFVASGRRKRPSSFFSPLLRPQPPRRIMYLDPAFFATITPISSLATSLFLSRSLPRILRLVLRSAREARVLPVPIVSCMINDRVDLSPAPTAYASFRVFDGSIDREGGAAKFERRTRRHLWVWFEKNSGNGNNVCELSDGISLHNLKNSENFSDNLYKVCSIKCDKLWY